MTAPLYDTGALVAAEANDRRIWVIHRRAVARGYVPVVPAPVMAQAVRGSRQASLHRMLAEAEVVALDRAAARAVGARLAAAGTADIVDAHVVCLAVALGLHVFTSDRADLEHLANATGARLDVVDV